MKDLGIKPILFPQPVLILGTYDENGVPNAMNAAWGGMADDDKIFICLASDHKTTKNLLLNKCMSVSVGTKDSVIDCDYVGIESGNKVINKLDNTKLTSFKAPHINAPIFNELPLSFECELISYDENTCALFLKIVNVLANENILDDKNKVDIKKLNPIIYDNFNHTYYEVGNSIGQAFKIGLKNKK